MITIALKQDFLPTDIQIGDPPASFLNPLSWGLEILLGAIFVVGLTAVLYYIFENHPKKLFRVGTRVLMVLVIVLAMGWVAACMVFMNNYSNTMQAAREETKENLVQNIHSVYDVELIRGIDIFKTSPEHSPELLVIQDEVAYEVVLKQNPETFEPTLVLITSPDSQVTELRKK